MKKKLSDFPIKPYFYWNFSEKNANLCKFGRFTVFAVKFLESTVFIEILEFKHIPNIAKYSKLIHYNEIIAILLQKLGIFKARFMILHHSICKMVCIIGNAWPR